MASKYRLHKLLAVSVILALLISVSGTMAQSKTQVIWFVGLGTGTNVEQIAVQEAVVEAFNLANPDIELVLSIAGSWETGRDALSTLIAAGNAPDIAGPVGVGGSNAFAGSWLDLQPLVDATGYDLSQFPQAAVDFYRTDNGLEGLPLGSFPSLLFFNRDLFDEAGLNYPPQEFGAPYVLPNGEEVEWTWDTLAEVAKILTVDANGADASEDDFDPENIVQFGYVNQWNDTRNELSIFGPHDLWDAEAGVFSLPDNFRQAAHWLYNAIWDENFIPNTVYENSELLQGGGGAFSSGNVAMARTHLWYTCCLSGIESWDLAFLPTHNGVYTSTLHADTFRVLRTTQNPEATFRVLTYLVGEASLDVLSVYGGMPAREEDRASFFADLDTRYPQGVNWAIAEESINYPDIPNLEAWYPNFNKGQTRFGDFQSLLKSDPNLDLDAELDKLEADLQAIVAEVSE